MHEFTTSNTGLMHLRDHRMHANPEVVRETLRFLVEQTKTREETGKGQVTLKELAFDDGPESQAPSAVSAVPRDPSWLEALVSKYSGDSTPLIELVEVPPSFIGELREYQQHGVRWLVDMSNRGSGVVPADDMGPGKTVQILALLEFERYRRQTDATNQEHKASLLAVPTGMLCNWAAEAAKFTPELKVGLLHGSNRPRGEELQEFIRKHDAAVITHGVAARGVKGLSQVQRDHVIADEAQAIRNPNTQVSKALWSLDSRHNIAMTGAPVENDLGELRTIVDFCNPGMLGSANAFRNKFATPIERDGSAETLLQLQSIITPSILRRLKSDPAIVPDLPKKNGQVEMVPLITEQAFLYQEAAKDIEGELKHSKRDCSDNFGQKSVILGDIMKLKRICSHPTRHQHDGSGLFNHGQHRSGRVTRLEKSVDEIVQNGEHVLMSTQFVEFGKMLVPHSSKRLGADTPFIQGAMAPAQHEKVTVEFNVPGGPPVILLSTPAAGIDINLVIANHVVHIDRQQNSTAKNQATDRSYRIDQRKDVYAHKLVSVGMLEERIDELIFKKAELTDVVVRAGETKLMEMDFHRLRSLWQLDQDKIQSLRESMDVAEPESGRTATDGVTPEATVSDSVTSDDDSIPNNAIPFRVQKKWY